jgi:hypothetical protein
VLEQRQRRISLAHTDKHTIEDHRREISRSAQPVDPRRRHVLGRIGARVEHRRPSNEGLSWCGLSMDHDRPTILLVEDALDLASVILRKLHAQGYRFRTATRIWAGRYHSRGTADPCEGWPERRAQRDGRMMLDA